MINNYEIIFSLIWNLKWIENLNFYINIEKDTENVEARYEEIWVQVNYLHFCNVFF